MEVQFKWWAVTLVILPKDDDYMGDSGFQTLSELQPPFFSFFLLLFDSNIIKKCNSSKKKQHDHTLILLYLLYASYPNGCFTQISFPTECLRDCLLCQKVLVWIGESEIVLGWFDQRVLGISLALLLLDLFGHFKSTLSFDLVVCFWCPDRVVVLDLVVHITRWIPLLPCIELLIFPRETLVVSQYRNQYYSNSNPHGPTGFGSSLSRNFRGISCRTFQSGTENKREDAMLKQQSELLAIS